MAVRHQYSVYEKKMLEDFETMKRELAGPVKELNVAVASRDSVHNFTCWADPWNPLFNSEEYAEKTRWGAVIAPPVYADVISSLTVFPPLDPRGGAIDHNFLGEDWEFFRPIYVGDSFTVVRNPPNLKDITAEDGSDPNHVFAYLLNDCEIYNQKNELVATNKMLFDMTVVPKIEIARVDETHSFRDHKYTPEELDFIQDIIRNEVVRGAEIRWWEDVQVGDALTPCSLGPSTVWDHICFFAARQELPFYPMRRYRELSVNGNGLFTDPDTGVSHHLIEWHLSNERANALGEPRCFNFGASARSQMARVVTNWMGDDGEITAMKWRHLKRTPVGDCQIGRGRVVGKREADGGHLVDVDVWLDNPCRGNVTEAAFVTVKLLSKADN